MALDFTTWCGFNFRTSNGTNFTADGTNEFGLLGSPQSTTYPTDSDKGWTTAPTSSNTGRAIDRRLYGWAQASSAAATFRVTAPNGPYFMRLAMGHGSTSARTGCIVVDGTDSGLDSGITGFLSASGSVSLNNNMVTTDNLRVYRCTTAGNYSAQPTGTGSNIQPAPGDTARFRFLGYVLHIADSSSTITSTTIWDVDNNSVAEGSWALAGGSEPQQKSITVQTGSLRFIKHPSATAMYLRHAALKADATPLEAVDLQDYEGNSLGSNPSIHAGQPTGKLIAKLSFATGSTANITLGGALAPYFQVVTNGSDKWLASLLPMPDGATGDLQIIQTDSNAFISGSPFTTTFDTEAGSPTLTIISSQGKPTLTAGVSGNTLAYALVSTQCWLAHKQVRDEVEATWDGWSDQVFDFEYDVTDSTSLGNAITSVNSNAGNGVWQRIKINSGTYTGRTWSLSDCLADGTGGLLIQGTGTHNISGSWDSASWRGVHFDSLTFSPGVSSSFSTSITGTASATMSHVAVVTNCTFGTDGNTGTFPIRFSSGTSLKVRNCTFFGFNNAIDAFGVRCVEIGNNEFKKFAADYVGVSAFNGAVPIGKGVLSDDHQYVWYHDCTGHLCYDNWSGYITNDNPHCDALQVRQTVIGWVAGTVYAAGTWVFNSTAGTLYKTAAGGTAGATIPSHTSGTVSDGAVDWEYVCDLADGPRVFMSIHGHRFHAASTTYTDLAPGATTPPGGAVVQGLIGFFIDSSRGLPTNAAVFNNICASVSSLSGWTRFGDDTQPHYVELNTFSGPSYVPSLATPGPTSTQEVLTDTKINGGGIFARKNIVGAMDTISFDEDNLEVSWLKTAPDPGGTLRGPFTQNGTNSIWGYSSLNESAAATQFRTALEGILAPLPANTGYGAVSSSSAASGLARNTALSLRLGLGL